MKELPKIALARLKAKSAAAKGGAAERPKPFEGREHPGPLPGQEHPDANLLSAFVEHSLTPIEQNQVLMHLGECADCRQVAALMAPEPEVVPAAATVRQKVQFWSVLRWGSLVAALGTLSVMLIVHPPWRQSRQEMARQMPVAVPRSRPSAAPPVTGASASPQALTPSAAEVEKPKLEQQEADRAAQQFEAAAGASAARQEYEARSAGRVQSEEQRALAVKQRALAQQQMMALSHAPAPPPRVSGAEIAAQKAANAAPAAAPAPAPPAEPAAPSIASADATKAAAPAPLAAGMPAMQQNEPVAPDRSGARKATTSEAPASPRVAAKTTYGLMAVRSNLHAVENPAGAASGPPAALWSIRASGMVQQSTDGGKTFHTAEIDQGVRFTAVAAADNDVWAGGKSGVLFHSSDGGATWSRVAIHAEGSTVAEDIAQIRLNGPQHLEVITASGEKWASRDGGQTWAPE